jgi:hypothetical protein
MRSQSLLASILMACLLAAGFPGLAPVANAESGGQSFQNRGKIARNNLGKIRRSDRRVRIHLPIGPSYIYYDYPYYYSRGYYPTHIGGYVYYPYYGRSYYPRYVGPRSLRHQR